MKFKFLTLVALASVSSFSIAQTLTGRQSTLAYNYVYGAGGDTHTGGDNDIFTTLNNGDTHTNGFTGATSGTLGGNQPYAANVFSELNQQYTVSGTLPNFTGISASASTHVLAQASGLGGALMNSSTPGNELRFNFTLADTQQYSINGNVTVPVSEAGFASHVSLQKWDGITWQYVFTSIFLPGSQGNFSSSGNLTAGDYRVVSAIALNAFAGEDWTGTYNYDLQVVPEPVTMLAVAPALMFLARKKRK